MKSKTIKCSYNVCLTRGRNLPKIQQKLVKVCPIFCGDYFSRNPSCDCNFAKAEICNNSSSIVKLLHMTVLFLHFQNFIYNTLCDINEHFHLEHFQQLVLDNNISICHESINKVQDKKFNLIL